MARILLNKIDVMFQKTLKGAIEFSGIGLHTGVHSTVRILPESSDRGISFIRVDIPDSPRIKASAANVVDTLYATTLGRNGATVSTVEHLLAALYGMGIDNALIEVDGPEIPIMDGSAADFVEMIETVGLRRLKALKKYLVVKRPIEVRSSNGSVVLLPSKDREFSIDYSIDFSHPVLGSQSFRRLFSRQLFKKELVHARTFGFLSDVETLRANGLAKGGSLENAVVIGEKEILNEEGLRYPDEFVRHKVLDIMGDISLLGAPVIGHLKARRSGHSLNHRLVKKVLSSTDSWRLVEVLDTEDAAHTPPFLVQTLATV